MLFGIFDKYTRIAINTVKQAKTIVRRITELITVLFSKRLLISFGIIPMNKPMAIEPKIISYT